MSKYDEQDEDAVTCPVMVSMYPNDIVQCLDNDDKVFMFIWQILTHEDVGMEMRLRVHQQLGEELGEELKK